MALRRRPSRHGADLRPASTSCPTTPGRCPTSTRWAGSPTGSLARGEKLIWGPSRHGPGNNQFIYFHDADGAMVECCADLARMPPHGRLPGPALARRASARSTCGAARRRRASSSPATRSPTRARSGGDEARPRRRGESRLRGLIRRFSSAAGASARSPTLDLDLYGDDVVEDSPAAFKRIRDAGPVVWLPRHRMWAIGPLRRRSRGAARR